MHIPTNPKHYPRSGTLSSKVIICLMYGAVSMWDVQDMLGIHWKRAASMLSTLKCRGLVKHPHYRRWELVSPETAHRVYGGRR